MIRIDKWLWYARFVKSRTLAQKVVKGGKIRVNGVKSKSPSTMVKCGDVLTITFKSHVLVCRICQEGERRGPFSEARLLYENLSAPENDQNCSNKSSSAPNCFDSSLVLKAQKS